MNCCGVLSECVRLQSCFFLWECLMFRRTRDSRLLFQQDIFIRLCWVQQTAFIHPLSAAKFKNHDLDPSILLTGLNKVYPGWKHSWHCGKSSHLFVCGLQITGNTAAFLSKYVIRELVFHNMLQALRLVFAGTAEGHDDETGHCVTGSSTSGFRPVWITPWGNGPVVRRVFADSQMVKAESAGQSCEAERCWTVTRRCESRRRGMFGSTRREIDGCGGETRKCLMAGLEFLNNQNQHLRKQVGKVWLFV